MNVQSMASHLNGQEYLQVRKEELYSELQTALQQSRSSEELRSALIIRGWQESDPGYFCKERVGLSAPIQPQTNQTTHAHLGRYVADEIDVGIEILLIQSMQQQMSSGASHCGGELSNVVRQGRGVPAVPLVIVGVAP